MEKETQNVKGQSSKRTVWTPPMDKNFMKLMVAQVHDGQYLDGQFSKHAWKHIVQQFKAKFGPNYDLEILKNHYRALKKNHSAIRTLIDQSGFGWDNDREMVYADDDQVWDDYVKAHPDFGIWRTKSITGYEDLCIIFGDGGASGKHSRAPSEKVMNHEKHIPKDAGNLNGERSQSPLVGSDDLGNNTLKPINLDSVQVS
ncbi:hypothetical protein IFM89_009970 [Coptis chinensis]|uniref:Myb/SANT-like domain-containing protein n=1 Tax=Coptis chinensis TaxID=261450 RepID=A0A835LV14_9MAGN|nr:hypothetical protein IFM89_009970 [Coptis chinensis]